MPKRDFLFVGCQGGHDWQSTGGCNAGCHEMCSCSVPVLRCSRCGDCDYGDNEEAAKTRADCATMWGDPAERFMDPPPFDSVTHEQKENGEAQAIR